MVEPVYFVSTWRIVLNPIIKFSSFVLSKKSTYRINDIDFGGDNFIRKFELGGVEVTLVKTLHPALSLKRCHMGALLWVFEPEANCPKFSVIAQQGTKASDDVFEAYLTSVTYGAQTALEFGTVNRVTRNSFKRRMKERYGGNYFKLMANVAQHVHLCEYARFVGMSLDE